MNHRKPRGHSNCYPEETAGWKDLPEVACITISGGGSCESCRPLPPLALRQEEWRLIGETMGWLRKKRKATKNPSA